MARSTYKDQVVNQNKTYERFAKDFINLHFHHDANDALSKNLHSLNIGMIEDLLIKYRALAEYFFNQDEYTDESTEEMIDMMNGMMPMPPQVILADGHHVDNFIWDLSAPISPVLNFECLFNNYQLELITKIANEVHLFTEEVKSHDMRDLFNCIPHKPRILIARDVRRLALFFHTLHQFKHISSMWQKVIADNELIASHITNKPLKRTNLSSALCDNTSRKYESIDNKIMILVEQIPKNNKFMKKNHI